MEDKKNEIKKLEMEIAEEMEKVEKLRDKQKKTDEKLLAIVKKEKDRLERENYRQEVNLRRTNIAIRKAREKKRKSRTHLLCCVGGEWEKTFSDLETEKATEFFDAIRKVFPQDITPEEICQWFFWLHQQKPFRVWANLDPAP